MAHRKRRIVPVFFELTLADRRGLHEWYNIYALCFPDENEREEEAEFLNILGMNGDAALQDRLGPWQEAIFAIRDPETGKIVGGLNFGMTFPKTGGTAGKTIRPEFAATVQVPFLFVDPSFRDDHGEDIVVLVARQVLTVIRTWVDRKLPAFGIDGSDRKVLLFFEANDPTRMTLAERRKDKTNAQIDPWLRYALWTRYAQPLDFPYVQPPLHPDKKPVEYLDLFCMVLDPATARAPRGHVESVPPEILRGHLHSFFSVSVLKAREDANENEAYVKQRRILDDCIASRIAVRFVDPDAAKIQAIKKRAGANEEITLQARKAWKLLPVQGSGNKAVAQRLERVLPQLGESGGFAARWIGHAYGAAYFLNRRFERLEDRLKKLDSAMAVAGVAATGALVFGFVKNIDWFDMVSFPSVLIAAAYGVLRFVVWLRRRQLGEPAGHIWSHMRREMSRSAGGDAENAAHRWLSESLSSRLSLNFGPLFGDDMAARDIDRLLERVLGYSEFSYSDRIFNYRTANGADDEAGALRAAAGAFCQGLWAAHESGMSYFSFVLPIESPTARDKKTGTFQIDRELATLISTSATISNLKRDACFLVHRTFADIPRARWPEGQALEIECRLALLALLHLGYFLENIADAGNLEEGLTRGCHISWWCPGISLGKILRIYGFEPCGAGEKTQDRAGGENDFTGLWSLSIDDAMLDSSGSRGRRVQGFVALLHDIVQRRNALLP